ncbi:DUF5961 family protein [Phenylobacterium sp.]|jgi:hypothetical protein|uniref:DUF5961 family protein n=1 Tax=Phenylobacterium sp. TaxID=1871053 RepID=UPI002F3ECDC5
MTQTAQSPGTASPETPSPEFRSFSVHARHIDAHHARVVEEASFEAAAVAYVEDLHDLPADDEIRIIVREVASGHEHCFVVDLHTGDAAPCA